MARAMSANLGSGTTLGAKFAILGRGPTATHDFIKAKIAILGRGWGKFAILGVGANNKGEGHLPGGSYF